VGFPSSFFFSCGFLTKTFLFISHFTRTCYMSRSYHPLCWAYLCGIGTTFYIGDIVTVSCYLINLKLSVPCSIFHIYYQNQLVRKLHGTTDIFRCEFTSSSGEQIEHLKTLCFQIKATCFDSSVIFRPRPH
jgi:hypothetical protein